MNDIVYNQRGIRENPGIVFAVCMILVAISIFIAFSI